MAQQSTRFESYPVDRFIEVVKAWVGHSWPITATEAQRVYETLGYAADPGKCSRPRSRKGKPIRITSR